MAGTAMSNTHALSGAELANNRLLKIVKETQSREQYRIMKAMVEGKVRVLQSPEMAPIKGSSVRGLRPKDNSEQ
jgi:hypothetical protein